MLCPVLLNHAESLRSMRARIQIDESTLDELTHSLAFVWIHEMGHFVLNSMWLSPSLFANAKC